MIMQLDKLMRKFADSRKEMWSPGNPRSNTWDSIHMYSDGSGTYYGYDKVELFKFNKYEQLIQILKSRIGK